MKIIKPSVEILTPISKGGIEEIQCLEKIGRTYYKSEDRITENGESAKNFIAMAICEDHDELFEGLSLSVKFIVDQWISYNLSKYKFTSFIQESPTYYNYSDNKFDEVTFIKPYYLMGDDYSVWFTAMSNAECAYINLIKNGIAPEQAQSVLPNSVRMETIITANYRDWRTFLKMGTNSQQITEIVILLLKQLKTKIPIVFEDIDIPFKMRGKLK